MVSAFDNILTILGEENQTIPLIFDSPHSGNIYPNDFKHNTTFEKLRQAEDSYVDELYNEAPDIGAILLKANFPRSYIDPNRAETDFSLSEISDFNKDILNIDFQPTIKTKLGIGLIWLKVPPDGEDMYAKKLTYDQVANRILNYHRPYHKKLKLILKNTYDKYKCFFHINCHSMQNNASAMSTQEKGTPRPDFVIGDRDGTSCNKKFTNLIVNILKDLNYDVVTNDPYKGMELVSAYSNPTQNKHSLQIEVNRGLYMDEKTRIKTDGFNALKEHLSLMTREIKLFVEEELR